MADEVSEAFKISYQLLHADAQIEALVSDRIYQEFVPPNESGLYILGSFLTGADVPALGTVRLLSQPLILWRVVRKGQLNADVRALDVRMDAVLQGVSATVSGGYVFSVRRERPYRRTYFDEANNVITETGGQYRYHVSRAA
jgi:hypothetical protein